MQQVFNFIDTMGDSTIEAFLQARGIIKPANLTDKDQETYKLCSSSSLLNNEKHDYLDMVTK